MCACVVLDSLQADFHLTFWVDAAGSRGLHVSYMRVTSMSRSVSYMSVTFQLHAGYLHVTLWVHAAVNVDDVVVLEAAHLPRADQLQGLGFRV